MHDLFIQEEQLFFRTYKRLGIDIVRGEGCMLYDRGGKQYLDLFGGLAVNALGYNVPAINRVVHDQVERYMHLSNFFVQESQVKLAKKLIDATGMSRVFFTNSGTEAMEGAIKLARKWGKNGGKKVLVGLSNSFHGRTMGSLSLTERAKYREGYEPFLPNIIHVQFNDVTGLRSHIDASTLGIVFEPIQGEGGVHPITSEFAHELVTLQKEFGLLLIADEIQTGIGRTGRFLACEHFGIRPDVVILAKAIGGGLPLGAFLGNHRVAETFTYGVHGSTFGGNPVSCAAGCAVIDTIFGDGLVTQAAAIGDYLVSSLNAMKEMFPRSIKVVRGLGCMIGVELTSDAQPVVDELLTRGILANCTNTTVIRLLPPYTVTRDQCDFFASTLSDILKGRGTD